MPHPDNPNTPLVHGPAGTEPAAKHVPGPANELAGKPLVHGAPVKDEDAHAKAAEAEEDALLAKVQNAAKRADAAKEDPKPAA